MKDRINGTFRSNTFSSLLIEKTISFSLPVGKEKKKRTENSFQYFYLGKI